jgi:hypothetical protein
MKKAIAIALGTMILLSALSSARAEDTSDEDAIKSLIREAYIDSLMNLGDLDKTRAGFHPDFVLLGLRDNQLTRLPIADWIASAEKRKAEGRIPSPFSGTFPSIDITGISAVAKIELRQDDTLIFTDYLSFYKFEEGWKIVGKIFHRHID